MGAALRVAMLSGVVVGCGGSGGQAPYRRPEGAPFVHFTEVAPLRIAGTVNIQPDHTVQRVLWKRRAGEVVAVFELCLGRDGLPSSIQLTRSSGHEAYDQQLELAMRAWRFRPYVVGDRARPVCSAVTFIYEMGRRLGIVGEVNVEAPRPQPGIAEPAPVDAPMDVMRRRLLEGETEIYPDNSTRTQMYLDGKQRLIMQARVCVDRAGAVYGAELTKSSGYTSYDERWLAAIRRWRFSPLLVDGKPVRACTIHTLIYNQRVRDPEKADEDPER